MLFYLFVALGILASVPAVSSTPVLQIHVSPQVGFVPMTIEIQVRQQVEIVAGREVCVALMEEGTPSCWREDKPAKMMTRRLTIREAGEYTVMAWVQASRGFDQATSNSERVMATASH